MKLIWRKKEFREFITLRGWALMRRRVNEMPAYLQPVGLGFSIVQPIRQGFWLNRHTGDVYAGFMVGYDNFHYISAVDMRSEHNWPEPVLEPLPFQEGLRMYVDQFAV